MSSSAPAACKNAGPGATASPSWRRPSAWATTSWPHLPPGARMRRAAGAWSTSPSSTTRRAATSLRRRTPAPSCTHLRCHSSRPGLPWCRTCTRCPSSKAACSSCWAWATWRGCCRRCARASTLSSSTATCRRATPRSRPSEFSKAWRDWPHLAPPWQPGATREPCASTWSRQALRSTRARTTRANPASPWPTTPRTSRPAAASPCHTCAHHKACWSSAPAWPARGRHTRWRNAACRSPSSTNTRAPPVKPRATSPACTTPPCTPTTARTHSCCARPRSSPTHACSLT